MNHNKYQEEQDRLKTEDNYFEALGFLNDGVMGKGSISKKHKELVALAVAITLRSEEDIHIHIRNCSDAGCSKREIIETLKISVAMGGKVLLPFAVQTVKLCEELGIE